MYRQFWFSETGKKLGLYVGGVHLSLHQHLGLILRMIFIHTHQINSIFTIFEGKNQQKTATFPDLRYILF